MQKNNGRILGNFNFFSSVLFSRQRYDALQILVGRGTSRNNNNLSGPDLLEAYQFLRNLRKFRNSEISKIQTDSEIQTHKVNLTFQSLFLGGFPCFFFCGFLLFLLRFPLFFCAFLPYFPRFLGGSAKRRTLPFSGFSLLFKHARVGG